MALNYRQQQAVIDSSLEALSDVANSLPSNSQVFSDLLKVVSILSNLSERESIAREYHTYTKVTAKHEC